MTFDEHNANAAQPGTADSIDRVVADMNQFLRDWVDRFQHCASQVASQPADQQLNQQIKEFELYRDNWEFQRQQEQEELEQVAQQLSDAWLHLEDQQRAVLQTGGVQPSGSLPPHINDIASDEPKPVHDDNRTLQSTSVGSAPINNLRVAVPADVIPRDVALRQFEKLKNEMNSIRR